ncbi:amidohydrolase family protein [Sorangium sp. So ce128]|uniref:amidohydrolase family protein n=1 Tax=Sorangium sp. So ce128 TaxID=3133281 RepID=UPI003F621BCB
MPALLVKTVDVITLNDAGDVLRGVDIAIEGGSIVAVGEAPPGFLDGSRRGRGFCPPLPGRGRRPDQVLQKAHLRDAEALPGDTVLRLASRNGARALGFEASGVIAPGAPADVILFDSRRPHLRPRNSLVGNLVYSARSSDIRHSIIAGRLVMKDHELLTLDEERILWEAERRAFAMLGRARGTALREYRG